MAADYSRIHRLLRILTLIQGSRGWTPARLAGECQTTERTIYRDLKMLEGAGIPYFFDSESGGYRIRKDFFMPPVQLTLDESLALAALAEQIGAADQIPFTKSAGRGIAKIRGLLPSSIRDELNRIEQHVHIKLAAAQGPEAAADVYETVRSAITSKLAIRCRYESASHEHDGEMFEFMPYALFFNQRAWYVVGHHDGRGEIRSLKLARFTMLESTDRAYSIPKSFSLKNHLGNAWRMIRGKTRFDVELWFDSHFADTISDTHWHTTQEMIWNDDDSLTFRCSVDGLDEIVWWVLGMGPHCVVKKPTQLVGLVRDLASGIVANYPPAEGESVAKK